MDDQPCHSRIPQGLNMNMHAIMTSAEVWMILSIRLPELMDTQIPKNTFLYTPTPSRGSGISLITSLAHTPLFNNNARESNKLVDDVDCRCSIASAQHRYQSLHIPKLYRHARFQSWG